jgi:tetratricopeptide (TPR) repeat protein
MQLRMESGSWRQARSLFDRCLELDPDFAPAWAERGRLDRIIGKYEDPAQMQCAEDAFKRALELDPLNGAAHHYYAQYEVDHGRLDAALTRLLRCVARRQADPQVYAALVHGCRYAGLLDESVAAHRHARRLDPAVPTSILHTYYMRGEFERALEESYQSSDPFEARVLGAMGRLPDAIRAAHREEERFHAYPIQRNFATALLAAFEGRPEEAISALRSFASVGFYDGEGTFYQAQIYARLGLADEAHRVLDHAVDAGFVCLPAFLRDPYLAPLRETPRWDELIERVTIQRQIVIDCFVRENGPAALRA